MKKQKGSIIVLSTFLITIIIVVGILYFYKQQKINTSQNITPETQTLKNVDEDKELTCYLTEKYFVIVKQDYENIGEYILVKKRLNGIPNSCEYTVNKDDFVFSGENIEYIDGDYLITDQGSAPGPRGLTVYDLRINKKVFFDMYSNNINTNNGKLTYWKVLDEKPTLSTCPKLKEYSDFAYLRSIVTVSLSDFKVIYDSKIKECLPLQ